MEMVKKCAILFFILIITPIVYTNDQNTISDTLDQILKNFYKDMPVLITGGCGFIGSHLAERLVQCGANVTIIDDLSSGKKENIAAIIDRVTLIVDTITDKDVCLAATVGKKIVFHFAAFISVPESIEKPQQCHLVNCTGTHNMLEAARINTVNRFVFSSSSAVYGNSEMSCDETHSIDPTSPYGFSKYIAEIYCRQYTRVYQMETVIMRYFNVYGKRQNPHGAYAGVVAKFMYNMEHNLPIIIFGDGLQTRDFISVQDVVQANLFLGMCPKNLVFGEVFNIATGKSITLFELIELLKKEYPHYTNTIELRPERCGDIKHSQAQCEKYFALLKLPLDTFFSAKGYEKHSGRTE